MVELPTGKALLSQAAARLGIMYLLDRYRCAATQFEGFTPAEQAEVISRLETLARHLDFYALHAFVKDGFSGVKGTVVSTPVSALETLLRELGAEVINLGGYPRAAQQYHGLPSRVRERFDEMLTEMLIAPPHDERTIGRVRQLIGQALPLVAGAEILRPDDLKAFYGHNQGEACPLVALPGCPHEWALVITVGPT